MLNLAHSSLKEKKTSNGTQAASLFSVIFKVLMMREVNTIFTAGFVLSHHLTLLPNFIYFVAAFCIV